MNFLKFLVKRKIILFSEKRNLIAIHSFERFLG